MRIVNKLLTIFPLGLVRASTLKTVVSVMQSISSENDDSYLVVPAAPIARTAAGCA
jgi:hypothetical protein